MKKKSASQSAFFNLRVLIGLFIVLAGVFLALAGFGTFSGITASSAQAQQDHKIINVKGLPPGFDCSRIHELGIDKMENLRAGLIIIACGEVPGGGQAQKGEASPFRGLSQPVQKLLAPLAYGGADVDVVLPDGTYPSVTQSETYTSANPDNPNQIVINYNDSRNAPSNYSGVSYSSDGGATFHALVPSPLATGHGTNFGDPVMLYNRSNSTWFGMDLATGCGGQGIGVWSSTNQTTWTPVTCAHNGTFDDRESAWVDNNSASPFYGRMYVSWNDFSTSCGAGGCLYSTHSSDGGVTYSTPVRVQSGSLFIRDVQITGDLAGSGAVYIAGMDEGGGSYPHMDTNYIYKSTDGGSTWTNTYVGTPFAGPGVCSSGYFAGIFSTNGCYWRYEGWGEPAAINNFVHLIYTQHGAGTDPGDVYYIRSTDGGSTFAAPFKLNTDSTDRPQWMPNLSVSPGGTLLATWYDARVSTDSDCVYGSPSSPCYQMFSRKSNDNGATWLPDDTLSDVISPLPAQPDGNVQGTYAGDYDYGTAITTKHLTSWTDGRVAISGNSQQDVFTDRELVGFSVTSTVPACNSIINTQPVDFTVNLSDSALPSSVQASDFTVNGIPANSFTYAGPPSTQIIFHYTTSPVTAQGPQTMHIPAGAILRNSDSMPIFDFTCTFCYATTPLHVTTTNPPVGGIFSPPAPGTYTYAVNFNQAIDPGSVSTSDLTLTGNVGATVTNVTVAGSTATFTLNIQFGGSMTASIAAGAITAEGCNSNAAFTGNYTVEGCPMMGWSPGASLPSVGIRLVGVFFPANGKFYAMGGRSSDSAGSDFTHPFEYDPVANTWTTKSATYPDNQVNNMACGLLTNAGTPYIYCVGGSAAGAAVATARVFFYNPVTDAITTLTAPDNWPGDAAGTILPGGFAVTGNKLYTLGGFNINVASTNGIYQFDPTAGVGAKWTTSAAVTPEGIMYAPTCAIGGIIYVGGASDYSGGTVIDTTNSFSFNPGTNTIGAIAPIPRATGETRALNINGKMLVMGGGRVAPNPSNEVDVYDPGTNTWTVNTPVPAFMTARRNFPTDTDGTSNIWLSGGYATDNVTPLSSTEVFGGGGAPMAQSAFSRKVHGAAGTFDIPLPLTGNVGVECRIGPTYQMIINFAASVTVQSASVTSGTGSVSSFSGSGTSQITVNLTGVTDQQRITMTLHGVNECTHVGDVPISMGVLVGDVNGNGTVSSADVALTKSQVGQTVGGPNFREDVNVNGTISSTDVALVKSDVGHALPP